MKLGVCIGPEHLTQAKQGGCDYAELSFSAVTQMREEDFSSLCRQVQQTGLAIEVMNLFLPGGMRLTGPDARPGEALDFARRGFARAQRLGVQVVVFGSGAARQVPDGFAQEAALDQLADFARQAAGLAARHGIVLAVEPLSHSECNVIHTVSQALSLCRRAGDPQGLAVLADLYHVHNNAEPLSGILEAGDRLVHCHIAEPVSRAYCRPGEAQQEYRAFFAALKAAGYAGRVSIEGATQDFARDIARATAHLRVLAAQEGL
ncbi:MAG: sugar phosphate isomerase/epimerase [Eubacteriales bacterium]|nr:sugar phosphate isomerase/epimerase [Eubacteriales bacterium]